MRPPRRTLVVSGRTVQVTLRLWEQLEGHDLVPEGYSCNGCSFSPDSWRGYKLWPACVIHDRHYDPDAPLGGNWAGRREADAILRRNLAVLLRAQRAPARIVQTVPWLYWSRVRMHGAGAYAFELGERSEGRVQRLREVYGLFRDHRHTPGVQPGFPLRRELMNTNHPRTGAGKEAT